MSFGVADTVTVDGKGQVEPGATAGGEEEPNMGVTKLAEELCVPDLGHFQR